MVIVVKNLPANAGDARDMGSIPGLGRSPGVGNSTHSNILAWKIPWTGGLFHVQDVTKSQTQLNTHTQNSFT